MHVNFVPRYYYACVTNTFAELNSNTGKQLVKQQHKLIELALNMHKQYSRQHAKSNNMCLYGHHLKATCPFYMYYIFEMMMSSLTHNFYFYLGNFTEQVYIQVMEKVIKKHF